MLTNFRLDFLYLYLRASYERLEFLILNGTLKTHKMLEFEKSQYL